LLYIIISYIIKNPLSNDFLQYFDKECNKIYMGEKKIFSTRIDSDKIKDLKYLAVDTDRSLGSLLEEAIQDLKKKYKTKVDKGRVR